MQLVSLGRAVALFCVGQEGAVFGNDVFHVLKHDLTGSYAEKRRQGNELDALETPAVRHFRPRWLHLCTLETTSKCLHVEAGKAGKDSRLQQNPRNSAKERFSSFVARNAVYSMSEAARLWVSAIAPYLLQAGIGQGM